MFLVVLVMPRLTSGPAPTSGTAVYPDWAEWRNTGTLSSVVQ